MTDLSQKRMLLVGLGQIGGSIGLGLVQKKLVAKVIGFDPDQTALAEAKRRAAVHNTTTSLSDGLRRADLIFLAAPLREIINLLPLIAPSISEDQTILDVGSTKSEILSLVEYLGIQANYIGGHPLAGTEKHGLSAADAGKFAGRTFVLTPTAQVPDERLQTITALITGLGAKPLIMTAEEHDRLIALTSNLPYLFSLALTRLALNHAESSPHVWDLVGGSFKSATRVSASSPELTMDMFMTNRENISRMVDEVMGLMTQIKGMIERKDEDALRALIFGARKQIREMQHG